MQSRRAAWSVWARSLLVPLVLLGWLHRASAQSPQETALARTLFQEGVALADRSDWTGAADRFERAYSLKPTPGIAFNWASALAETGALLHAQELLLRVQRDPSADVQLRHESESALAALEPRIARLRVQLQGEPSDDTVVLVDDRPWPRAAWGIASPLDPGAHTVVLRQADRDLAREHLTLRDGERRDLTLSLELAPEPSLDATASPSDVTSTRRRPLYKSWVFWTAVGAVAAGGVVTAVVLANRAGERAPSPVMGNATPGILRW